MTDQQDSPLEGRQIRVPGSISNLGPGFDTISVAIDLYLRVRILERLPSSPDTLDVRFRPAPPGGENRIATAFRHARALVGRPAPGLRVEVESDIPARAGLGSSGAATVAGLLLYEAVTSRRCASDWLAPATGIEGHPDNAAASLMGGLVLSCQLDDGQVIARALRWPADIRIVVATPHLELETAHARSVLPSSVGLRDAVFNLQRALLLLNALNTGRTGDLREALRDRWHQPFRAPLVPGLSEALAFGHPAVLGTFLSGAGPSVVALTLDGAQEAAALFEDLYIRLGVPCTVRTLSVHQPEMQPDREWVERPSHGLVQPTEHRSRR